MTQIKTVALDFERIIPAHQDKRHILLLQGPLGPFFAEFAGALSDGGMVSHKINFNAGDACFAAGDYIDNFTGKTEDWADYLRAYVIENQIETLVLFGDSRFYHTVARQVCREEGVRTLCLEEGYVRPGYVTAEWGGNNANSPMMKVNSFESADIEPQHGEDPEPAPEQNSFWRRAWWAVVYYHMRFYYGYCMGFSHYRHHRPGSGWGDLGKWIWSGVRKYSVRSLDHKARRRLAALKLELDKQSKESAEKSGPRLFFCPLQVAIDAQIIHHSSFESVEDFIAMLIKAFAKECRSSDILLFKHHPMDRGYKHYQSLIAAEAKKAGVADQMIYCFDVDLDEILSLSAGCVTVNSTVGFIALQRFIPTFSFGPSFYEELTYGASFSHFMQSPECGLNPQDIDTYLSFIKRHALVSGDFYDQRHATIKSLLNILG